MQRVDVGRARHSVRAALGEKVFKFGNDEQRARSDASYQKEGLSTFNESEDPV
jgi:hypothetical protein